MQHLNECVDKERRKVSNLPVLTGEVQKHAGCTERTVLSQVMVIVSLTMSKTTLVKYGSQARFCSKHFSRVGKMMTAMRMRLNGSC